MEHTLKIEHCAGDEHLAHWETEIQQWRMQMAERLADNPSLTGSSREILGRTWDRVRHNAVHTVTGWARHQRGSRAQSEHRRIVEEMLPAACPNRLFKVTRYDTEERRPEGRGHIMPPAVARQSQRSRPRPARPAGPTVTAAAA